MKLVNELKSGLFRYEEAEGGWVVTIKTAYNLLKAAEKVRDAGIKRFDCYSPFPIHGLDTAMGLKRSWLPLITLLAGLSGVASAMGLMVYVMVIDWPLRIGGKPHFSWPAFIPITFELMVLFAGLATVAGVIFLGRLGKIDRKPVGRGTTSESFSIWIGDEVSRDQVSSIIGDLAEDINEVSA